MRFSRCTCAAMLGGLALLVGACAGDRAHGAVLSGATVDLVASGAMSDQRRLVEDEIIYFVLPDRFENGDPGNDRGGIDGGRLDHGFDPADHGFYHGGDLKGLLQRLDYIEGLGVTAIWLSPIFENRFVQGPAGAESAGYHGYWVTNFLNVDPHLGTREDFKALVEAAHDRGMKVYMDIITNHTADVIAYRECHDPDWPGERVATCAYRSIGDYPWTRRGGQDGVPINSGFLGDDRVHQTAENFSRLTQTGWAYTPFVPELLQAVKVPAWLNDPVYYHNRGDTDFIDEDSLYGDFAGLDDLNTSHPRVVAGMIDIYKAWISDFAVDGYRIDTAKHVRTEFWQAFAPAILAHARAEGIADFAMFGEVYAFDPAQLARYTTAARLPAVLDFAFQGAARGLIVEGKDGLSLDHLFAADAVYAGGSSAARRLPTFLGNHDMGRFAGFLRAQDPAMPDDEMLARTRLGYGLAFFARGVPTIYYGDEQGFVSDGGDRLARENMFASQVAVYNDNDLIATSATTAERNFDTDHPLYRAIAGFAAIRTGEPALRRGEQVTRLAHREDSLFVFSRIDHESGTEIVIAINAEKTPRRVNISVDGRARRFTSLVGQCATEAWTPGAYTMDLPALDLVVCKSEFEVE